METAIYALLKENNTEEIIGRIVRNEIPLTFVDSKGTSLLMLSSYFRNKPLTAFLLERLGRLTIFEACATGLLPHVEETLSNNNGLIESVSPDGFTPLGLACYFGHYDVVAYLLEKGADPNVASSNALRVAPLHSAVAAKQHDIVKLLLKYHANVNAVQQKNYTALHGAAHLGNFELTKLLLDAGADRNIQTTEGATAWDMAKAAKATDVMILLMPM